MSNVVVGCWVLDLGCLISEGVAVEETSVGNAHPLLVVVCALAGS